MNSDLFTTFFALGFVFKVFFLILLFLYIIFAFIVITFMRSLGRIVIIKESASSGILQTAVFLHFLLAVSLFFIAVVIL